MTAFDAELYLRLLGEDQLVRDAASSAPRSRILDQAAAALVAANVIDEATAAAVASEYSIAGDFRTHPGHVLHSLWRESHPDVAPATELFPRQTFQPPVTLQLSHGTLTLVSVTTGGHGVGVVGRLQTGTGRTDPHAVPDLLLRSPRDSATARYVPWGGGAADGTWQCQLAVAPTDDWLEIEGHRIALSTARASKRFEAEDLPVAGRLERFLWHLLSASPFPFHGARDINAAIIALVAAGSIDPAAPAIAAVMWAQRQSIPVTPSERFRGSHARFTPTALGDLPESTPPHWRLLFSQRRPETRRAKLVRVSAMSPRFDGVRVAVETVKNDQSSFTISAEIVGTRPPLDPSPGLSALQTKPLLWWASDDLENQYLGLMDEQHPNFGGVVHCPVYFGPIAAEATRLTLTVSTPSARAQLLIRLGSR